MLGTVFIIIVALGNCAFGWIVNLFFAIAVLTWFGLQFTVEN